MKSLRLGRAFTLIEMLLVVSVIALLLALLTPTLRAGKCHADKVRCASNMHSMGNGLSQFIMDNQRELPGPSWYGQSARYNNSTKALNRWLAPYMGYPRATSSTSHINQQFICPSFQPVAPTGTALADCVIYGALSETNKSNGRRVFGYPAFDGAAEYGPSGISSVRNPATAKAIKDIDQYNNPTAGWVAQTARVPIHCYTGGSEALRNYLFFDFHVETIREFLNGSPTGN